MFRPSKLDYPVDYKHFGAGTILSESKNSPKYIVVATSDYTVQLMLNGKLVFKAVDVLDVNWLSRDEADELIRPFNYTMSDFDIDNKGIK